MTIIIFIYFFCAVLLTFYGINCHLMIYLFNRRYPERQKKDRAFLNAFYSGPVHAADIALFAARLPGVTTQIPIYNERNVAERLIDAVAAFTYPAGRHHIQVLDDSTDVTRGIIARKVKKLQAQGVNIEHIRRNHREGFKAGALKHGLSLTGFQYVAIFDADFIPRPDFLLRTMPFFIKDERLGFAQARWGHINRRQSLITRLQAIGIDGHFMVEQSARNANGLFMNFNGTAGVFRKSAIIEAGNWQGDTLTEDMDLSYRIQLAGWSCRYLIDLEVPAEIPQNINSFKNQQFRWAKGSTQTAIKLLPRIFRSGEPLFKKIQAALHMTHYVIHPLMLFLAIMAPVVLVSGQVAFPKFTFLSFGALLVAACLGPSRQYFVAERKLGKPFHQILLLLPIMVCFGCGLAINNSRAVIEAIAGKKSAFIRTPKNGFKSIKSYIPPGNIPYVIEIMTGLYCLFGMIFYFYCEHWLVGHFLLIYAAGYLYIGGLSFRHSRKHP